MKTLRFYNLRTKKSFETDDYDIVEKGSRRFAVAEDEDGTKCWRIIGKD